MPLVITDEFGRSSYIISVQRLHYFFPAGEPDKRLSSRESADILERLLHITLEEPHVPPPPSAPRRPRDAVHPESASTTRAEFDLIPHVN